MSLLNLVSLMLGHTLPQQMDPIKVREIKHFLQDNQYPDDCSRKERYYIKRRCENFTMNGNDVLSWSKKCNTLTCIYLYNMIALDGELHYICRRKKDKSQHLAKVVLSPEEAHNIFMEFHTGPLGGHCGVEKTHNAIILRFYWPGMEQDIRKWVS